MKYNKPVYISVCVQKMVRSDLASAGVAFSIDTESNFTNSIIINSSWGLGSNVVDGEVNPDEFITFKPSLKENYNGIIDKKLGEKKTKVVYSVKPDEKTIRLKTDEIRQNMFSLTDEQIMELSKWVMIIEDHYSEVYNKYTPIDVEFAVDGLSNEMYIVQARPITTYNENQKNQIIEYHIKNRTDVLISGVAVGNGIGHSKVKVILSLDGRDGSAGIEDFSEGDVLVTDVTDPSFEPLMEKASAIITNKGSRTSHAAIISRELGIPCVVGTLNCTRVLKNDQYVTVVCCEGERGFVYDGKIDYKKSFINVDTLPTTKLDIKMNIANPNLAFKNSRLPNKGVGLVRLEFIIANYIKVHTNALLKHKSLGDLDLSNKIETIIKGYKDEKDFFIKQLAYGIGKIAAAFHPHQVVVRFSDFKTNEYAKLLGAYPFETNEENPMIGWRGCSRYYHNDFKEAFGLECEAIKMVRDEMNLTNVVVMLPFARSVDEVIKVQEIMKENGLERGKMD